MLRTSTRRALAVLGASGLLLSVPAVASAQSLPGGSLGEPGRCTSVEPFGSLRTTLDVRLESKPSARGVALLTVTGSSQFGHVSGTLHWVNETTHATGDARFGPFGGDLPTTTVDVPTGAGHVTWSVTAARQGSPLLAPLSLTPTDIESPTTAVLFSDCTGAADIA